MVSTVDFLESKVSHFSNKLTEAGIDVAAFSRVFRCENVAKFAPLTRTQFEELKSQVIICSLYNRAFYYTLCSLFNRAFYYT